MLYSSIRMTFPGQAVRNVRNVFERGGISRFCTCTGHPCTMYTMNSFRRLLQQKSFQMCSDSPCNKLLRDHIVRKVRRRLHIRKYETGSGERLTQARSSWCTAGVKIIIIHFVIFLWRRHVCKISKIFSASASISDDDIYLFSSEILRHYDVHYSTTYPVSKKSLNSVWLQCSGLSCKLYCKYTHT
jgi:hypothetical protein